MPNIFTSAALLLSILTAGGCLVYWTSRQAEGGMCLSKENISQLAGSRCEWVVNHLRFIRRKDQGRLASLLVGEWEALGLPAPGISLMCPALLFGNTFTLTALAGPGFVRLHPLCFTWWTALLGLSLTAAFITLLKLQLSRHRKLDFVVAERKQAEEKRCLRTAILEAQVNATIDGIMVVDLAGKLDLERLDIDLVALPDEVAKKPRWHGKRVLLAEDNRINQKVALGFLQPLGLQVDVVANGVQAIQALGSRSYELVLMDIQMPEMDGLEATRLIRSSLSTQINPHVPIIAMTSNAMQSDRMACLDAGMNEHIPKPINPLTLVSVLEQWLP